MAIFVVIPQTNYDFTKEIRIKNTKVNVLFCTKSNEMQLFKNESTHTTIKNVAFPLESPSFTTNIHLVINQQ